MLATDITLSSTAIAENQPAGAVVGALQTTDPDVGSTFAYTLVAGDGSTDNASFRIDGNQLRTATSFDFETKSSYSIRLRSTDQGGAFVEKAFPILVQDMPNALGRLHVVSGLASVMFAGAPVRTYSYSEPGLPYDLVGQLNQPGTIPQAIEVGGLTAITFSASGQWNNNAGADFGPAGRSPSVSTSSLYEYFGIAGLDNAALGMLVGVFTDDTASDARDAAPTRIDLTAGFAGAPGLNQSFPIGGDGRRIVVPAGATRLYLGLHDAYIWSDNWGEVTVGIGNAPAPPTDIGLSASGIMENQPAGTTVGVLSTTDADIGDAFTYTLVSGTGDTDNAVFNISGNQLRSNANFDFEVKNSYSVRIRSTDQGGLFTEKAFAITVTNVNETPTNISLSSSSIAENAGANAVVGTLSTADPDASNTFSYTLVSGVGDTDNAVFNISGNQLRASAGFDFEVKSSYSVRIRSTDQGGLFTEKAFTINVTDVGGSLSAVLVRDSYPADSVWARVGSLAASEPLASSRYSYSLVSGVGADHNGLFSINGNALFISAWGVRPNTPYSLRVRVANERGTSTDSVLSVAFTANQTAVISRALSLGDIVAGRDGFGTAVTGLSGSDGVDPSTGLFKSTPSSHVYDAGFRPVTSVSSIDGTFVFKAKSAATTINSSGVTFTPLATDGQGMAYDNITHNREPGTNAAMTLNGVTYANGIGINASAGITFDLRRIGQRNGIPNRFTASFGKMNGVGAVRGYVIFSDDSRVISQHVTRVVNDSAESAEAIDLAIPAGAAYLTVATGAVGAITNDHGVFGGASISVSQANAPPTDITISSSTISESAGATTVVGTFSTTDPGTGNTFTYTLVSGEGSADNASFTIVGDQLRTAASFDYEARSSYSVRVRSTDQGGLFVEKAFTIQVADVNETPTDIALSKSSVVANQPAGAVVGLLRTADQDGVVRIMPIPLPPLFKYSLVAGVGDSDNRLFNVVRDGYRDVEELVTAAPLQIGEYSIRVRSTDVGGLFVEKVFTITVVDKPSAPANVTGIAGVGSAALSWTPPASSGGTPITAYRIEYSSNSGASWTTFADGVSAATTATVTGLTNGTAYIFRVSAVNAVGPGAVSANSSAVTPALVFTPMAGVTIGGVEFGTTELGYAFRHSGQVRQVTYGGRNTSATYPGSGWTMRGVWVDGTGYRAFMRSSTGGFAVWTLSSAGAFVSSQSQTATQVSQLEAQLNFDLNQNGAVGVPPAAPTGLTPTAGNGRVSLVWKTPSSNGGAAITDYVVQYSSNSGSTWLTFADGISTTAAAVVTGLTNGTAYLFRVSAVNSAGTGTPSASTAAVTPALVFTPTAGVTIGTVEFGTTELGYAFRQSGVVRQVTYNGRNTSATYPGSGWTMRGVWVEGAGYKAFMRSSTNTFAVWTLSATGAFVSSQAQTATQVAQLETQLSFDLNQNGTIGTPATAPAAPTGLTPTAGNARVSLVWTAPSSNGGAAISDYVVQYSSNSGSTWLTFADGISTTAAAVVTGLTNGTAYLFRVSAVNSAGTGTPSASTAPVTPALVFTPTAGVTIGTVEFGTTELGYAFRQSGVVRQVTYNGRNTSATYPGSGWTMRGVWVDGTDYKAFMRSSTNTFAVWTLSATGAFVSSQAQTATQVRSLETQLSFDLDQSGTIG